jgi:hypothetical protein
VALSRALRAAPPPVAAGLAVADRVPGATAIVVGRAVGRFQGAADALAKPLKVPARARIEGAHRRDILRLTTGTREITAVQTAVLVAAGTASPLGLE